ncbi:unnamed protein product [Acanthoscelides obtectus]|uniref:Uncharacterized protein n=1 Tax=Acanthoscelides obtectus TaxID=200917 RepID=A0A9P0QGL4_ACAOB|nr:unnamed protein product [Acanthoscelides obtectus]CAK1684681.1 hypothetical protein AOBTE_LOCUS35027 [Acanthoscelides obtectus]
MELLGLQTTDQSLYVSATSRGEVLERVLASPPRRYWRDDQTGCLT